MNTSFVDWPVAIEKPELPQGYEWVCLAQAFGIRMDNGEHPWWIRLCWTIKGGKKRMLRLTKEFFPTTKGAIDYAVAEAVAHAKRRA